MPASPKRQSPGVQALSMQPSSAARASPAAVERQAQHEDDCGWLGSVRAYVAGDPHRALGLFFIFLVAVIWVAASFLVQEIESQGLQPLVLTYIANSLFALCLPVHYVRRALAQREAKARVSAAGGEDGDEEAARLIAGSSGGGGSGGGGGSAGSAGSSSATAEHGLRLAVPHNAPYDTRHTFYAALVVAPLWFLAQLCFNASLGATSVTSNTILSSTSSLFTFGLAVLLLHERYCATKLASILVCMAGTAAVTLGDSASGGGGGTRSAGGDALAVLSALLYASYTLAIRLRLPDDDKVSMLLFFGFVGVINFAAAGPVVGLCQVVGAVDLRHLTRQAVGLTVIKGLFDNVLSDVIWARAVLLVGPTVATVGLSIQVPLAVALDVVFKSPAWLHHARTALLVLGGGALVLLGFFGINYAAARDEAADAAAGERDKRTRD